MHLAFMTSGIVRGVSLTVVSIFAVYGLAQLSSMSCKTQVLVTGSCFNDGSNSRRRWTNFKFK